MSFQVDKLSCECNFESSTSYTNYIPGIGKKISGTIGKLSFYLDKNPITEPIAFNLNNAKELIIEDNDISRLSSHLIILLQKKELDPKLCLQFINQMELIEINRNRGIHEIFAEKGAIGFIPVGDRRLHSLRSEIYCYTGEKESSNNDMKSHKLSIEFFEESASMGSPHAQYLLALKYIEGKELARDLKKAHRLLEQSAEKENPWAVYYLGNRYYLGDSVEKDMEKAIKLWTKAKEMGVREAWVSLNSLK